MIEIYRTGCGFAGSFFRTSAWEKGAVEDGQLHFPSVIWNGDWEEAGIFVVHMDEIDIIIWIKGRETQTLPVKQILRYCQSDPRAYRRKRRVSHHVALEPFHKRNARIFAAAAAVRSPLVFSFRFERNAKPLDSDRIACLIKLNTGYANARIITPRDEPWKQVKLSIRSANSSRIQNTFDLLRITWLRFYH